MDDIKHEFDPRGDVILILRNPNAPFAVWPWGEGQEWPDLLLPTSEPAKSTTPKTDKDDKPPMPEPSEIKMRVSSRHLALASPQFKAMLEGPWKEGSDGPPYTITAEDWDEQALRHVMNIIHGHTLKVPRTVGLELFARIAIIVDYYQCHEVVDLYKDTWFQTFRWSPAPATYCKDIVLRLLISCVFGFSDWFGESSLTIIRHARGPFCALDLPIPQAVAKKINEKREYLIRLVIDNVDDVISNLSKDNRACSYECSSMMTGVLFKHLSTGKLVVPPPPPFLGYSVDSMLEFMSNIKEPTWSPFTDVESQVRGIFKTGVEKGVNAGIDAGITMQLSGFGGFNGKTEPTKRQRAEKAKLDITMANPTAFKLQKHNCTIASLLNMGLTKARNATQGLELKDFKSLRQPKGSMFLFW